MADKFQQLLGANVRIDTSPGKTSWEEKCALLQNHGITGLLYSPEVMDVSLGIIFSTPEQVADHAHQIIDAALSSSNYDVLHLICIVESFDFKNRVDRAIESGQLSVQAFDILANPVFGININYPILVYACIKERNHSLLRHLLHDYLPHSTLQLHSQEYLSVATEADNTDAWQIIADTLVVFNRVNRRRISGI